MQVLNTKHKRRSAVITACILLLFIFAIFNFGMQYLDPPEEYGLAINFGNSNVGSGEPLVNSKKTAVKEVLKNTEVPEAVQEVSKETVQEEMSTEDTLKEVPVVEKVKEILPVKEQIKKVLPKAQPKPKPSKENQDALNKLLSGTSAEGASKGEGDATSTGVKGKKDGDPASSKYYENTGSGAKGDYNLAGRKALSKPKRQPDCQEEGVVVVRITVNNKGKVLRAIPGVKGTTNTAPCLAKPAKEAALNTTWNVDSNAPKIQTGTIIYKFSLSK